MATGHLHLDHAGTGLAFDFDQGEFVLGLLHVFLHLLGLLHQAGDATTEHGSPFYVDDR
ncbi:hypothetical protein SDC9_201671 [bioreactor metagenome]|uniref:Uncharacterized protein n=1 Tax=bioreactor metagenome TaxID=1076179 RepID=A0A645IT44_9ZZZZ